MILDARELEDGAVVQADVCIVGAGAPPGAGPMTTSRREFLATTLSGLGALLLGGGCGSDGSASFDPDLTRGDLPATAVSLEDLLAGWFDGAEQDDVQAVGQAWMNSVPDEAQLEGVFDPIVGLVSDVADTDGAGAAWDDAIASDFDLEAGVVVLHGWQLAVTECALCALMTLFGPGVAEVADVGAGATTC